MSLNLTIEKAAEIAGSQRKLAELLGIKETSVSDMKYGRKVCGLDLRIQLAEIAGTDQLTAIFEYFADSLDETDDFKAEAKRIVTSIVTSLTPETNDAPESKKPLGALGSQGASWRKRRDSNPR